MFDRLLFVSFFLFLAVVFVLYSFISPPPGQPHAVLGGFEGFFIFGGWMLLGKVLKLKMAEAI